jgi:hypothetical protein
VIALSDFFVSHTTDSACASYCAIGDTVYFVISNCDAPTAPPDPQVLKDAIMRSIPKRDYGDLVHRAGSLLYLYRNPCKRIHATAFRAARVIHQPCWSSRRWRSLT